MTDKVFEAKIGMFSLIPELIQGVSDRHAESASADPAVAREARRRDMVADRRILELRREAAERFGADRGWKRSRTQFSPRTLARNGLWGHDDRYLPYDGLCDHPWDHPYFYREHKRAVAVVAHLYDSVAEALAWAPTVGLVACVLPGASWWFPGWSELVLYQRAA